MIIAEGEAAHKRAAKLISSSGIVAFRTDTFYGLGANPFDEQALHRLNLLKGREGKPLLIVISDASMIEQLVEKRSILFDAFAARHWPGALTIVAPARTKLSLELTAGTGTIGLRLPDDEEVRCFVRACGSALTATSANRAGEMPARTATEVASFFPSGLDLIVDAGPAPGGKPSTVLDVSNDEARVIREGAVSIYELKETLDSIGAKWNE